MKKMTLWSSTAHPWLWNVPEPSLWLMWKAETEKCELEGGQHPRETLQICRARNSWKLNQKQSYHLERA